MAGWCVLPLRSTLAGTCTSCSNFNKITMQQSPIKINKATDFLFITIRFGKPFIFVGPFLDVLPLYSDQILFGYSARTKQTNIYPWQHKLVRSITNKIQISKDSSWFYTAGKFYSHRVLGIQRSRCPQNLPAMQHIRLYNLTWPSKVGRTFMHTCVDKLGIRKLCQILKVLCP